MEIDVRVAAMQEVNVRKKFSMQLLASGACFILVIAASAVALHFQAAILSVMLLMWFFIENNREKDRLVKQYG